MYKCVNNLTIIGLDKDLSPGRLPSHYLNQCWNIVNCTLRNKFQWNFNRYLYIFVQENAFENVVWKILAILSWPQCVKAITQTSGDLGIGPLMIQNTKIFFLRKYVWKIALSTEWWPFCFGQRSLTFVVQIRQEYPTKTRSMPWLLMPWLLVSAARVLIRQDKWLLVLHGGKL